MRIKNFSSAEYLDFLPIEKALHNYLGCLRKDIFLMTNDINFWTGIKDPYLITYTVILGVTSNITGYPIKKSSNGYPISLQI